MKAFFIETNNTLQASTMNFKALKQFEKEFKKFSKKYVSLGKDIQTFKNIIEVNPKGQKYKVKKEQKGRSIMRIDK